MARQAAKGKKAKAEKESKRSKKVKEEKVSKAKAKVAKPKTEKESKRSKKDATEKPAFNPYGDINSVLNNIEKDLGIAGAGLNANERRMSTGQLALDLVIGGGMVPGWYTFFGPEQSCKSTSAMSSVISSAVSDIPYKAYFDAEGSGAADFIGHQLKTYKAGINVEQLFGVEDANGNYVIPPLVRYSKTSAAEKFFDFVKKLQKRLPDKVFSNDKWWYIYDDNKKNRELLKGADYDEKYFKRTGRFRIEAPDGNVQAIIVVDSYPALLSEKMDDEDNSGQGMASQARMFSEQIKRVAGGLSSKRIIILGVNQVRQKPMAMFSNPEYEPCGDALKFYSSCRVRFNARTISGAPWAKGKGMIEEEPSVNGKGTDQYRYIHMRGIKNKLGMPYQEGWMRLWIEDRNAEPRGFDPVFDTFWYLNKTGQVTHSSRKKIVLRLKGKKESKPIEWLAFKSAIVGDKKNRAAAFERMGLKPFDIRKFCHEQLYSGTGMELYAEMKRSKAESDDKEDGDED